MAGASLTDTLRGHAARPQPLGAQMSSETQAAKTKAVPARPRATSKHEKAGLVMPVAKMHAMMKKRQPKKKCVGTAAAVYAAAVVEYAMAEVLEVAHQRLKDRNKDGKMLMNKDVLDAVRCDEDLQALWGGLRFQLGDKVKGVRWGMLCPWDRQQELQKREKQREEREVEAAKKAGMPVSRFRAQMQEKRAARDAGVKKIVKPSKSKA